MLLDEVPLKKDFLSTYGRLFQIPGLLRWDHVGLFKIPMIGTPHDREN